ncbi:hypothetical protein B4096_1027 [Heyndrickxia coagulans]|nr:hypothetical protein B4096_1027 [Heyndrickxia coagulans]
MATSGHLKKLAAFAAELAERVQFCVCTQFISKLHLKI